MFTRRCLGFFFQFGGVLKKRPKVIVIKKQPAKAATMVADKYVNTNNDSREKSVSFCSEDEVVEIEPRQINQRQRIFKKKPIAANVKARLGKTRSSKSSSLI